MYGLLAGIGVVAGLVGSVWLALTIGKSGGKKPPSPNDDESYHRCHYCDQWISRVNDTQVLATCPNCKDTYSFHGSCHHLMPDGPPQCHGVDMRHVSGHTLSLKYPSLCAACGLGKDYWKEMDCGAPAMAFQRGGDFSEYDRNWMKSIGIDS